MVCVVCVAETKAPKRSNEAGLRDWSKKSNVKAERVNYTAEFMVNSSFGVPGAITVSNNHQREFFLETITIEGFACGPVHFFCNSWVQSRKDHPVKRILFSNKVDFLFLDFSFADSFHFAKAQKK
jgi:lipoxygenase